MGMDALVEIGWYFDHGRGAMQARGIDYASFVGAGASSWCGEAAHDRLHGFRHRETVNRCRRIETALRVCGVAWVLEAVWCPAVSLPGPVAFAFAWRDRSLAGLSGKTVEEMCRLVAGGKSGPYYERCRSQVEWAVDCFDCAYQRRQDSREVSVFRTANPAARE